MTEWHLVALALSMHFSIKSDRSYDSSEIIALSLSALKTFRVMGSTEFWSTIGDNARRAP